MNKGSYIVVIISNIFAGTRLHDILLPHNNETKRNEEGEN
jgi:hypothetical protein